MYKKTLTIFSLLTSLILATSVYALSSEKDIEVITDEIYEDILEDLDLTSKDIDLYKKLFEVVDEERWDKEEKRVKRIQNDVLLGHALAKKYLSKTYKSSSEELEEWLEKYSDLPQYNRIYWLANKRAGGSKISESVKYSQAISAATSGYSWHLNNLSKLSDDSRKYILDKVKEFRKHINSGKTLKAKQVLEDPKFRKVVPNRSWDAMAATLITVYFIDGYDKQALQLSEKPTKRSNDTNAYWFGGLSAWRLGDYKKSAEYFSKLTTLDIEDDWLSSAAGYWAYRSYAKLKDTTKARQSLKKAAQYKRTFYGILACYELGEKISFNWEAISYKTDFSQPQYLDSIISSLPLKRAIILASIGQKKLAGQEIMSIYKSLDDMQKEIAMFIARQYDMNLVAIQISNNLRDISANSYYDYIAYPYPNWDKKVWNANKALVLALVRQESAFEKDAVSIAGARGLMQLMPTTAVYISKNKEIKDDLNTLFDHEYNLELGQKYVNYLLEKPYINGNLFFLATAYNAGPGNLLKWKNKTKYNDDPLLFIEAIPARQTRVYIERVMANYWIYSSRMKKKIPTLKQISNGDWPTL